MYACMPACMYVYTMNGIHFQTKNWTTTADHEHLPAVPVIGTETVLPHTRLSRHAVVALKRLGQGMLAF